MRTRSKRILLSFGVLVTLAMIFIAWFDWNMMKPYIERQIAEKTGRELMIEGNLDVALSLNPLITAEGLSFANADWGIGQPMLGIDKISFRVSLLDLFKGNIILPEISISQPKIILEKNADGRRNWDLKKEDEKEETKLPEIGRLTLDQGTLIFRDPKNKTDVTVKVFTDSTSADVREMPIKLAAEGKFTGLKFTAQVHSGEVDSLADKTFPFPIKGKAQIGTTRATFDGTITGLQALSAMDLKLELQGNDLSALYPIIGVVIFSSPPYRISGRLRHQQTEWSLKGFSGKVGKSDLGGDVLIDTGGERPMLRADVVSQVLDLEGLSGFIGARRAPQPRDSPAKKQKKKASIVAQRDRILPDQKFKVDRLRAMDADVKFTGKSIRNKDLPIEHLITHLKIDNGLLTLDPVNFAVAGGNIVANVTVNARGSIPAGQAKVDFKQLHLPKLFPGIKLNKKSVGKIGGTAQLKSRGKSVGALLGAADGHFGLIMSGGQVSNMMLAMAGLDGAEIIKLLFTGDKNVKVRCAVADFDIKKGLMESNAFIIDTADTNILGEGQISLAKETIEVVLSPRPKDFSIMSLRTPIHISGTFKEPEIYPNKMLAIRVSAAVLLGVFATPFAALIPLIETGPGKDNNCKALIASVKKSAQKNEARSGK